MYPGRSGAASLMVRIEGGRGRAALVHEGLAEASVAKKIAWRRLRTPERKIRRALDSALHRADRKERNQAGAYRMAGEWLKFFFFFFFRGMLKNHAARRSATIAPGRKWGPRGGERDDVYLADRYRFPVGLL